MAKKNRTGVTPPEAEKPGMVSVFNKGLRVFKTSAGDLVPNKSLQLPEGEAAVLLKYPEVIKTGDVPAKESRTIAQLKAENEKLKADLEKAKAGTPEGEVPGSEK